MKTKRIGEQGLIKDDDLLDWFPVNCKEISEIQKETTTAMLNFMQRGSKKY